MSNPPPLTITATVAAWMSKHENPMRILDAIERDDTLDAIHAIAFYGAADRKTFGDWIRVGEADVTVRLLPRDEQVRAAMAGLQAELDRTRAEWMTKQQEILERISKLQAITYDAEAA